MKLLEIANAAVAEGGSVEPLREALRDLRIELEQHLDYEERVIAPLLFDAGPDGASIVKHMEREHAEQRSVLVALTEDASEGGRDPEAIVEELAWFTRGLLSDMDQEDAALLAKDVLGVESKA